MQSSQDILIQHIESYRESHDLNYSELANELQIPYTTLMGMLHKKRIPRIDTIDLLAQALSLETYELFLPLTLRKRSVDNRCIDAAYEEELLAAVRRMSKKQRKLLMLYVHLLEEIDAGEGVPIKKINKNFTE